MEVFEKDKISPNNKSKMFIPLCKMISMLIVQPTLQIDVLKMGYVFHLGYHGRAKMLYISQISKVGRSSCRQYEGTWNIH
jgi:hypothetical protein